MKKLFATVFLILAYAQSFAYNILQTTLIETTDGPPPPDPSSPGISPFSGGDPGIGDGTPINFIVPFLLLTVVALTIYSIRKNKMRTV